jgi:hypothetical protein
MREKKLLTFTSKFSLTLVVGLESLMKEKLIVMQGQTTAMECITEE